MTHERDRSTERRSTCLDQCGLRLSRLRAPCGAPCCAARARARKGANSCASANAVGAMACMHAIRSVVQAVDQAGKFAHVLAIVNPNATKILMHSNLDTGKWEPDPLQTQGEV